METKKPLPTTAVVARAFCAALADSLGHELDLVREANKRYDDPNVCATHDFCDANMIMDGVMRECGINMEWDSEDGMPAFISDLWDAAWAMAREAEFYADRITGE